MENREQTESRYIVSITSMSAHNEYADNYTLPLATPVVSLKRSTRSELKNNEHIVYAKSPASAWARALKLARKIGTRNLGVDRNHAIKIIQLFNHEKD